MDEISRGHHLRWVFAALSVAFLALAAALAAYVDPVLAAIALLLSVGSIAEFVVPKVFLRSDTVVVRKVFRTRTIALRDIERVDVDPYAAHFTLMNGSRVSSPALQTGLIYRWLGRESGADRFAGEITRRARMSRGDLDER